MKIYQWWDAERGNSHILEYRNKERQTSSSIFNKGYTLPFDCGYTERLNTLQDPKDYDLVYHAEIPEEKLLTYDCMPNNGQAPLVNRRVLGILLEQCPDEFQYFPVTIVGENPKNSAFENRDYFLINICQTVDGIDKERSDIIYFDNGDVRNIKNLVLKENMKHFCISRLQNSLVDIIVSEPLVKAFKKAKVNGVKFEMLGETTFID